MNWKSSVCVAALAAAWLPDVQAEKTTYRCIVNGQANFQHTPCVGARPGEHVIDARPKTSGLGGVNNPDLVEQSDMRLAVERGRVKVGMTAEQVKRAWGEPDKINSSSNGSEQWIYRRERGSSQYVYLDGGVVSAWN